MPDYPEVYPDAYVIPVVGADTALAILQRMGAVIDTVPAAINYAGIIYTVIVDIDATGRRWMKFIIK